MAQTPFDEILNLLRAEDLQATKKMVAFHLRKNKWRISAGQQNGPLYLFTGPAGETAVYAYAGSEPVYLGASLPDELLAGIEQVHQLQLKLTETRLLLNGAQQLMARKLRKHGLTTRQAGAALDLVQGRIWQLTQEGAAQ